MENLRKTLPIIMAAGLAAGAQACDDERAASANISVVDGQPDAGVGEGSVDVQNNGADVEIDARVDVDGGTDVAPDVVNEDVCDSLEEGPFVTRSGIHQLIIDAAAIDDNTCYGLDMEGWENFTPQHEDWCEYSVFASHYGRNVIDLNFPDANLSRAEMIAILNNGLAKILNAQDHAFRFADVPEASWYTPGVRNGDSAGIFVDDRIVTSTQGEYFCPHNKIAEADARAWLGIADIDTRPVVEITSQFEKWVEGKDEELYSIDGNKWIIPATEVAEAEGLSRTNGYDICRVDTNDFGLNIDEYGLLLDGSSENGIMFISSGGVVNGTSNHWLDVGTFRELRANAILSPGSCVSYNMDVDPEGTTFSHFRAKLTELRANGFPLQNVSYTDTAGGWGSLLVKQNENIVHVEASSLPQNEPYSINWLRDNEGDARLAGWRASTSDIRRGDAPEMELIIQGEPGTRLTVSKTVEYQYFPGQLPVDHEDNEIVIGMDGTVETMVSFLAVGDELNNGEISSLSVWVMSDQLDTLVPQTITFTVNGLSVDDDTNLEIDNLDVSSTIFVD